jgi:hypothetical protein
MLSEALQRNAKHEAKLLNVPGSLRVPRTTDQRFIPRFIRRASLIMFWLQGRSRTPIQRIATGRT